MWQLWIYWCKLILERTRSNVGYVSTSFLKEGDHSSWHELLIILNDRHIVSRNQLLDIEHASTDGFGSVA